MRILIVLLLINSLRRKSKIFATSFKEGGEGALLIFRINYNLQADKGSGFSLPFLLFLFQFKYAGIQLVVGTLFCDQFIVGAPLDDMTVIQNHNAVGVHNGT